MIPVLFEEFEDPSTVLSIVGLRVVVRLEDPGPSSFTVVHGAVERRDKRLVPFLGHLDTGESIFVR